MGINVTKYKMMAFVTSAVLAGMAGALYGLNYLHRRRVQVQVRYVHPRAGVRRAGRHRQHPRLDHLRDAADDPARAAARVRRITACCIYAIVLIRRSCWRTNNPTLAQPGAAASIPHKHGNRRRRLTRHDGERRNAPRPRWFRAPSHSIIPERDLRQAPRAGGAPSGHRLRRSDMPSRILT